MKKATPEWIETRIEGLLSHYPADWREAKDVRKVALVDWIAMLEGLSEQAIESACASYLRDQPRERPTPGAIRAKARGATVETMLRDGGDRKTLPYDERALLEDKILPAAKRWLLIPGLREYGKKTLEYWDEPHG